MDCAGVATALAGSIPALNPTLFRETLGHELWMPQAGCVRTRGGWGGRRRRPPPLTGPEAKVEGVYHLGGEVGATTTACSHVGLLRQAHKATEHEAEEEAGRSTCRRALPGMRRCRLHALKPLGR